MTATSGVFIAAAAPGGPLSPGSTGLSLLSPVAIGKIALEVQLKIASSSPTDRITVAVHVFWNPNLAPIRGDLEAVKSALVTESAATQAPIISWAQTHQMVVLNHFWLTNVIVVTGTQSTITALSNQPQVTSVIPNFAVTLPPNQPGDFVLPSQTQPTWNIAKVRAPDVWEQLGIKGAGVRVATTDTGIEISHPDLAGKLSTDNPNDPTYPGGWIEFDGNGNIVPGSTPHDTFGHGTATLSLIVGGVGKGNGAIGNGFAIGVAPDATAMHALVLPNGGGTFAQVVAGLQWVINPVDQFGNKAGSPARVSSHSWGAGGFQQALVEPIRNMRAAGHVVIAAIGNCGNGCTGSPGNIFDTISAGSTTINDDVSGFSSGAKICKSDWPNPPPDWPDCYLKPEVSAPGENVVVAYPPDTYRYWSGTSFSSPHTAGVATLMVSANPGLSVDEVQKGLQDHAFWQPKYSDTRPDTRYGWGRIDAFESVLPVAFKQGIRGTVTDSSTGQSVSQAKVTLVELGRQTMSKADGTFEVRIPAGTYTLSTTRFAYLDKTIAGVAVPANTFVKQDIALNPAPVGIVSGTVAFNATGIGMPGVLVDVLNIPVTIRAESTWDGTYSLSLPVGTYALKANLDGFSCTGSVGLVVTAGGTTTTSQTCVKLPRAAVLGDWNGQIVSFLKSKGVSADAVTWTFLPPNVAKYDLIVIGTMAGLNGVPSQPLFMSIMNAADAAGTGIMFLDNWGGGFWYSGIQLRSLYMGDPAFRSDNYYIFTPTYYVPFQPVSHPIFNNVVLTNTVWGPAIAHTSASTLFNDHAWFYSFSGQLTTLASMANDGYYNIGQSIAVQQRANNRHILLSSSGPEPFNGFGDWSDASKQLFVNSVNWAARPTTGAVFVTWDTVVDGAWKLSSTPTRSLWSQDTSVPIGVKNVGTASGSTKVSLNVRGMEWASQVATLAPGAQRTLSFSIRHWTTNARGIFVIHDVNPPGKDTAYDISSAHLGGAFIIRPPTVTVNAFTIDVRLDPIPLQDATVEILWKDAGNNPYATNKWFLVAQGTIGKDGSLSFPSSRSRESYTIIVRAQNYGVLVQRSYLETRPVAVDADTSFRFAPTTANSTVVDLKFDAKDVNHDAWVYLTSPDLCPEISKGGCVIYPYSPATLVATPNPYAASVLFAWQTLDARWWYPTKYQLKDWTTPQSYRIDFGGNLLATIGDVRGQQAPSVTVGWDIADSHGWSVALIAYATAGKFAAGSIFGTQDWATVLAAAPTMTTVDPKLTLFSPGGKILNTGTISWADRPKGITFDPSGAGVSSLLLRSDTGPWMLQIAANSRAVVPAQTIEGWVVFPGATIDVRVTFDAPMANTTSVALQEILPSGPDVAFTGDYVVTGSQPRFYSNGQWVWAAGDYKNGEILTVTYKLRVKSDATIGDHAIVGNILTGTGSTRATAGMRNLRVVAEPKGAVSGYVEDIAGEAFSGAAVQLSQGSTVIASGTTDSLGSYVVLAPKGDYTLCVSRVGYTTACRPITLSLGQLTLQAVKGDWTANGVSGFAPMPEHPSLMYVLRVLDRWTNGEIKTSTVAVLINKWKGA
jgi:hypothetical protein